MMILSALRVFHLIYRYFIGNKMRNIKQIEAGSQFTYWRVLGKSKNRGFSDKTHWRCQCVCGRINNVRSDGLISGKSRSCGCLRASYLLKFEGKTFNYWTILKLDKIVNTHRYALCQCICGYKGLVRLASVRQGSSKSCGCQPRNYSKNKT